MTRATIREAVEVDLELIVCWWAEMVRAHAAREEGFFALLPEASELAAARFRSSILDADALVLAGELEGVPVGFANAEIRARPPILRPGEVLHVENIYVSPEARRCGVASGLLERIREWGRQRDLVLWSATVYCWNEASASLCARLGLRKRTWGMMGALAENDAA